jgi:gamma-glutamyltranspeptidase / glutathione hydrolase
MKLFILLCISTLLTLTSCSSDTKSNSKYFQKNPDNRSLSTYQSKGKTAMIASAGDEATQAGLAILKKGGNAIDAAVAVSFAISVLRPQSTGIGGGGFMLVYSQQHKKTFVFDFRERAPLKATRNMYVKNGKVVKGLSVNGILSVATPGIVAGLAEVHQNFGSLAWKDVIQPAIELAENGFTVYPALTRRLENRKDIILNNQAMLEVFFDNGTPIQPGVILKQKDLAKTLKEIAQKGKAGFYEGWVANAITQEMKIKGGLITQKDLTQYQVKQRTPVEGTYRGYKILSMPPPSSGGTHVVQMLNMLESFDLTKYKYKSPEHIHLMTEVMRQAYADRAHYLGDPDFVDIPLQRLISKKYAKTSIEKINLQKARSSENTTHGFFKPLESSSTTHFSIVGPLGNVVSSTQTINYSFGSCVMVPGTGIILNDEMDDFSAQPGIPNVYGLVGGEANSIQPLKTPLSSMSPTLVFKNNKPYLVLGSPGGSRIITAVLQTIVNVIDYNMPLLQAVAHGRIHHQWLPDKLFLETPSVPVVSQNILATMGHVIGLKDSTFGDVQAIQIHEDGTLIGVSDPRHEGMPMGY